MEIPTTVPATHPGLFTHPMVIVVFGLVVILMLMLDLGVFNKKSHVVSNKEAAIWTLVWIGLSMAFSGFIYVMTKDTTKLAEFQTAYWIEKALSVDNLFVFILVFGFFNVPRESHHKVLFWGIVGALVLRGIFIFSGVGLIKLTFLPDFWIFTNEGHPVDASGLPVQEHRLNVLLTLFGIFLVYAGIKSAFVKDDDEEKDFSKSPGARFIHKIFKVSKEFDKDKFFTVENGVRLATPLLVVVGVIEFTDLLFAVDSIPAIFAVSSDPFVLYASNIFAILGLRSMYFLLSNLIHLFSKLKYGLAVILSFIGVKMVIAPIFHIESWISLLIVGGVLLLSILLSLVFPEKPEEAKEA
ncbi:MAG: hypothetical protein RLZZ165_1178 [Bacteroidota bacterium]|jgi:tellurite resistance protein TerC